MIDVTTKAGAIKAKKHIRHQFDKSGISYERFLDCLRQAMVNQVRLYDILNNENVFPTQTEYQEIIKALASIDTTQKVELTQKRVEHLKARLENVEMPLTDFVFDEGFDPVFEKLILQKFSKKLPKFVLKRDLDHFLYLCRKKQIAEHIKITPDLIDQMQKEVKRTGIKIEEAYLKTGLKDYKPKTVARWFKHPSKRLLPKNTIDSLFNVYAEIPDRIIRFKIQCRMSDLDLVKDNIFK